MKNRHSNKGISLRVGLITMVALCWILPICIVLGIQSFMLSRSMDTQIADVISSSMQYSCRSVNNALTDAIGASRQMSYDNRMKAILKEFAARLTEISQDDPSVPQDDDDVLPKDISSQYGAYQARVQQVRSEYYPDILSYISNTYSHNRRLQCTILFMYCDKDLYTRQQVQDHPPTSLDYLTSVAPRYQEVPLIYALGASASYSEITYYRNSVHAKIAESVEGLGPNIGILCQDGRVYIFRNILDSRFNSSAVIVTELNNSEVFGTLPQVVCATDSMVTVGGTGIILSSDSGDPTFSAPRLQVPDEVSLVRSGSNYSMCVYMKIEDTPVCCCVNADASAMVRNLPNMGLMMTLVLALAIPMMALVVWVFYRFVTRPVRALIGASKRVEEGEMGYNISVGRESSEMMSLIESFNSMSSRLKELFDRSREEQLALQDARVKALQSQINPHFLNNTLEIINWEARMAGDTKVTEMIEALSTMLSAATIRNSNNFVTMADEMTYVDAYLLIISTRLGKRLTVHRDIDESLNDVRVPQLIMQPVVENAIEHGISRLSHGELYIRTYMDGEGIAIEIENSGAMTPEDEEAVNKLLSAPADAPSEHIGSVHVGIKNVNQRLKLIYGPDSGLSISKSPQNGTLARIFIKLNN